jgi:hypothetical protein
MDDAIYIYIRDDTGGGGGGREGKGEGGEERRGMK